MGNSSDKENKKETVNQNAIVDIHRHLNNGYGVTVVTLKENNSYVIMKKLYEGKNYYYVNYNDDSYELYDENDFNSYLDKRQKYMKYIVKTESNKEYNFDFIIKNYIQSKNK